MNAVSATRRRDVSVRPRFGLAGAALLTAICVVALALTGSGPGSNSADADADVNPEPSTERLEGQPFVAAAPGES